MRTLVTITAFCTLAAAQIPGRPDQPDPHAPLKFALEVEADRPAGPVDVTLHDLQPTDVLLLCSRRHGRLADGTVVQFDAAAEAALRLRFVAAAPLTEGRHELEARVDREPPVIGFAFEEEQDARVLRCGERRVYRFERAYDPDRREQSYKPFHHVFAPDGETLLTKGPGGTFPHHRGVFLGYNQVRCGDDKFDFWHCTDGASQRWQRPTTDDIGWLPRAGAVTADSIENIRWCDADGTPIVVELRRVSAWDCGADGVLLDFTSELSTVGDRTVTLDGDPHHAGLHFRSAQEVHEHQDSTGYARSDRAKARDNDIWADCDWVACRFTVAGREFVVQHHAHPGNPSPYLYSTRAYGRFGSVGPAKLEPGAPVVIRHRIVVQRAENADTWTAADVHAAFVTPLRATVRD